MKQLADMESCEGRKRESLAAIIQYLQSAGRSSVGSVLRACEHGPALGTLRHSLSVWYSLARCWRYFVAHGLNRPHLGCDLGSGAMPCPSHCGDPRSLHRWRCGFGAQATDPRPHLREATARGQCVLPVSSYSMAGICCRKCRHVRVTCGMRVWVRVSRSKRSISRSWPTSEH